MKYDLNVHRYIPQIFTFYIYFFIYTSNFHFFNFHFFALISRTIAALSSAIQHAMPPKFGRKWGMECLNIRFPLPTLMCAGYSLKVI